jgi:hypothetical protein
LDENGPNSQAEPFLLTLVIFLLHQYLFLLDFLHLTYKYPLVLLLIKLLICVECVIRTN